MYTTLQEAPEVLQPVGVDFTRARTRRHGLRLHAGIHQALHTISAHR
jgi:hypothetical protein